VNVPGLPKYPTEMTIPAIKTSEKISCDKKLGGKVKITTVEGHIIEAYVTPKFCDFDLTYVYPSLILKHMFDGKFKLTTIKFGDPKGFALSYYDWGFDFEINNSNTEKEYAESVRKHLEKIDNL